MRFLAALVVSVVVVIPAPSIAQTIVTGPGTYSTLGNSTFGPDGAQTQIGNSIFAPNGTTYANMGNSTLGSDGSSYTSIGNTTFGSDGSSSTRIGNSTFINGPNGSMTCTQIGSQTFCN